MGLNVKIFIFQLFQNYKEKKNLKKTKKKKKKKKKNKIHFIQQRTLTMMTDSSICISEVDNGDDDDNDDDDEDKNNNISEQCLGEISMCSCNQVTLQYFCV